MDYLDFVKRALSAIDAEIASVDTGLLAGAHADHAATRQAVGKRQGLVLARGLLVKSIAPEDRRDIRLD